LQELLTLAIVLESGVGVVKAATVGLDDQAVVSPEEVRFEPTTADLKGDVDLGSRKPALTAHAEEHTLQFTASPPRLRMEFIKDKTEPRDTATASATPEQGTQGG